MRKLTALAICLMFAIPADAGPRGSSGGSSSRPSSSGGSKPSSSKPSSSSWGGGSKSTSSWGGGSSSKPSSSSGSKPVGSNPGSSPKPSSSSWGGGSSSSGKTVTKTPIAGKEPVSVSKKPTSPGFDTLAKADAKKVESRASYEKSQAPKPTYKTPAGKEAPIDPKSKEVERLRGELDHQKWVNRQQRSDSFYTSYRSSPVVIYSDPFHPMMNYWLMSQSIGTMAMMMFHHQASMDAARMNAMYAQNANLRA